MNIPLSTFAETRKRYRQMRDENNSLKKGYAGLTLPYLLLITLAVSVRCSPGLQDEAGTVRCRVCIGTAASSSYIPEAEYADIFVFNDDALMRLDSYQRMKLKGDRLDAVTTGGKKIICVVANSGKDRYDWTGINSYNALCKVRSDLRNENPDTPTLSGETYDRGSGSCDIVLEPLLSKVVLQSLRCNFEGKAYEGATLDNAKVYLTNVNSSFRIMERSGASVTEMLNAAGLNASDMASLLSPELLSARLPSKIGSRKEECDISLWCYPNNCEEESLGSRFTRLVIEGEILGKRYWWPININRGDFGPVKGVAGVSRNCEYSFDICLTSLGSDGPDKAVSKSQVELECGIMDWVKKDGYEEYF